MSRCLEVVKLTFGSCPEEGEDESNPQKQSHGYHYGDYVHRNPHSDDKIITKELMGIRMAAIIGLIKPISAKTPPMLL